MKPLLIAMLSLFVLISCNETNGKRDTSYLSKSVGNINSLQVIIENDLWNGTVGEEIRNEFAAPVDGLPQDEPLYSMNQMPPATYTDFARKYRLFLHATIGTENKVNLVRDLYAKPQTGVIITATSEEKLIELLKENYESIIEAYHASEIKERQKRTRVSLLDLDSIERQLGITLKIPSAYRVAKATDDFYWIRKDLKSGTTNIIAYDVPMSMISSDSTAIGDIIKIRDSIGGKQLPVEDDSQFITEEAYAPYLFNAEIDGKFAYETKGIWEVKGEFMSGPFINYAVRDEKNDRYIILEGFSYAPAVSKRDLQFELESILKSAELK